MTQLLKIRAGHIEPLPPRGVLPAQTHIFDQPSIFAINAALASRRPLLVRGEPGIGTSQLARAAARCLKRPYLELVVDARTEARDLLWSYDAVARLAEAQLGNPLKLSNEELAERLAVGRYVRPGPLWWALNWAAARKHPGCLDAPACDADEDHRNGCVLLIDEIDKAESEVPNGLLEALGNGRFVPFGAEQAVDADGPPPLVIITTNEERELPPAFLRRCWVLYLALRDSRTGLEADLRERALAHFPTLERTPAASAVLEQAIKLIADQRIDPTNDLPVAGPLPRPGVAELLDLLRAVTEMAPHNHERQLEILEDIQEFALVKNRPAEP
jgi:MoxR-like ATPase